MLTFVGVVLLSSCDEADPSVTARVDSVEGSTVCISPEDMKTWERLAGCYPTSGERRVRQGDCIRVRVPSPAVDANKGKPLREVEVLERRCIIGD